MGGSFEPKGTEQLLQRWEQVLRVLKGMSRHTREKHFRMAFWGKQTPCGTVGCAAGHCGLDPWFRRRGFKLQLELDPYSGRVESTSDFDSDVIDFFGWDGARRVFFRTGSSHKSVVKYVEKYIVDLKCRLAQEKVAA